MTLGENESDVSARVVSSLGTAQSTLLRILGELAFPMREPVPTSVLLGVMEDVGFSTYAARRAVSRCAQFGSIASVRDGREARWTLTDSGVDLLSDGIRRVQELGSDPAPWDGQWLVLIVSIPHERRVIRQRLHRALSWAGFGSPVPGIWVTAYTDRRDNIAASISRLGLSDTTMSFIGSGGGIGLSDRTIVEQAWDLDAVARTYASLVTRFTAVSEPRRGTDAIRSVLEMALELQGLASVDPHLPAELVPNWSGRLAAEVLLERRAQWLVPARAQWASLVEPART